MKSKKKPILKKRLQHARRPSYASMYSDELSAEEMQENDNRENEREKKFEERERRQAEMIEAVTVLVKQYSEFLSAFAGIMRHAEPLIKQQIQRLTNENELNN